MSRNSPPLAASTRNRLPPPDLTPTTRRRRKRRSNRSQLVEQTCRREIDRVDNDPRRREIGETFEPSNRAEPNGSAAFGELV
ncbi:MAG: hypothetical protein J6K20_14910, partial [Thermoguttaceae bacterium]|nr:hypothetical protein [Thermoguttaceae bacterium]